MKIPEILYPLVAKGVTRIPEQVLTYWRDYLLYTFPDGARLVQTYLPREGYVFLVIGVTLGRPRNFDTGDILVTDDYGFWHRHSQMRWHWDPGVESLYEFAYPHWLEVTRDDPLEMEFYNNTGLTVIQDLSIWLLECGAPQWKEHVVPYLKGHYNLFKWLGEYETLEKALEAPRRRSEG